MAASASTMHVRPDLTAPDTLVGMVRFERGGAASVSISFAGVTSLRSVSATGTQVGHSRVVMLVWFERRCTASVSVTIRSRASPAYGRSPPLVCRWVIVQQYILYCLSVKKHA